MRISVANIEKNMIIDEDIYNEDGGLILSKGLSVSDENILKDLLIKNNIKKVKVLLLAGSHSSGNKIINYDLDSLPYDDNKKREIQTFINEFGNVVDDFEKEIIDTISGNADRTKLENLLEETMKSTMNSGTNVFQLLQKLKDSDDYTFVHCNSVSLTAYTIGKWLKLSEESLKELSLAALVFDVGKFSVPKEILQKEGTLTDDEYAIVKSHVEKSLEILRPYNLSDNIMNAVKYHHERCDGSGYPYGLKANQIPTMARILALADMFVALTSKRPHRDKYTPFQAIKILEEDYMQKLDIVILSEFIKRIATNYVGNMVRLSNGLEGEVLFINATAPLRPIIKIISTGDLIDLSSKINSEIYIKEFV